MSSTTKTHFKISLVGFGNMAQAIACNLLDSGWDVEIFLRNSSPSHQLAQSQGFRTVSLETYEWNKHASPLYLLLPDHAHENFMQLWGKNLPKETPVLYGHGFSLCAFELAKKFPELQHILFAPKAIAREVRQNFLSQRPTMAAVDLSYVFIKHQSNIKNWVEKLAKASGVSLPLISCSFQEECLADLFTEQSILCYFLPYLAGSVFKTLKEGDRVTEDIAFVESCYEMKLIINALLEFGPKKFFSLISPNALIGSQWAKKFYEQNSINESSIKKHWEVLQQQNLASAFSPEEYGVAKEQAETYWQNHPLQAAYERWKETYFPKD